MAIISLSLSMYIYIYTHVCVYHIYIYMIYYNIMKYTIVLLYLALPSTIQILLGGCLMVRSKVQRLFRQHSQNRFVQNSNSQGLSRR